RWLAAAMPTSTGKPAARARILPPAPHRLAADFFAKGRRQTLLCFLAAPLLFWLACVTEEGSRGHRTWNRGAVACGILGMGAVAAGWRSLRQRRLAAIVARKGEDILCPVLGTQALRTAERYQVEVPGILGRPAHRVTAVFPSRLGRPFFVRGGSHALALVVEDLPEQALVLREDLWPLLLSDEQRENVCKRLRQVDPDGGWRLARSRSGLRLLRDADAAARHVRLRRAGAAPHERRDATGQ